jgi:hypothetical protein
VPSRTQAHGQENTMLKIYDVMLEALLRDIEASPGLAR